MKNAHFRRNVVSSIALAMIVLITNLAYAESPAKGADKKAIVRAELRSVIAATPKGGQEQDRNSQEELEQMRSALLDLAGSVKDLTELSPDSFDASGLDEATGQLAQLSHKQLGMLRKALNPAKVSERLAVARASVAEYKLSVQREGRVQIPSAGRKKGGAVEINSAGFPAASGLCGGNGPNRIPVGVVLAADIVYFIAETVRDLAQDGCNEVIVILGEGGNGRLVCIATDIIYIVAHAVYEGIHFCDDDLTGNIIDANYARLGHIHTDLENSVANDNSNKTMIVNNDNSNKTAIIADVDSKAAILSAQIDAGTTAILTDIDNSRVQIINNDNVNRTQIINNDNTNTANILTNANANKTMIINNDNANFAATINELRALGCDVIRLLHTPDGLRTSDIASCAGKPGWPYSWNKKTSAPVTISSSTAADVTGGFSSERAQDGVPILPIMGTVTMESHLLAGKLVPTYYLPAGKGGLIEQVKQMVWNTIESQTELNIARDETAQARLFAQEADQLLSAKKYVEAYRQYSLAYQKLVPAN